MSTGGVVLRLNIEAPAKRSRAAQSERLEQAIKEAERRLAEHEARIREASLTGRNAMQDNFDLQRLHLLIAILREGRVRALGRLEPT